MNLMPLFVNYYFFPSRLVTGLDYSFLKKNNINNIPYYGLEKRN